MRTALAVFFALHFASSAAALGLPWAVAWFARRREALARGLVTVTLVNLSTAVVLGVAAILFVTRAWPKPFVTSAVSHFALLLAVVPLLSAAFASMYAYQIRGWRPGPAACGVAVLAIGIVFSVVASFPSGATSAVLRAAHFVAAAPTATGLAIAVRFAGTEEARLGVRLAFFGFAAQAAVGASYVLSASGRPGGILLWMPAVTGLGLLGVLAVLARTRKPSRFLAVAASAGYLFATLSWSAVREASRG